MNPRFEATPDEFAGLESLLVRLTRVALDDASPGKCAAVRQADRNLDGVLLSPSQLGMAAAEAVRNARRPLVDSCTLRSIRQWWVRCAEEGWFDYALIDAAFVELARASHASGHPSEFNELLLLLRNELAAQRRRAG